MSLKTKFDRILVAVDGSESSFRAVEVAAGLASKLGAEVTLLCVILQLPNRISRNKYAARLLDEIYAQLDQDAKKYLEMSASLISSEVRVKREILRTQTSIVQAIVEYATDKKSNLIVLSTRGLGGFRRMLLGSVSSGVATHAPIPVLVVRTDHSKKGTQFRHVLAAVDGSENASKATIVAADVAKTIGADLTLVHVMNISPNIYSGGSGNHIEKMEKAAMEEGKRFLSAVATLASEEGMMDVKQELIIDTLSPARGITEYAEKNRIDLIVVGTRGLGGFKRLLLGSVASGVLSYAHCSALVVR